MADPEDSVDDIPSDSLSMSSEMPEQEEDAAASPWGLEQQAAQQGGSYFGQAYDWASAHPVQAVGFGTVAAIAVVPAIVTGPALAAAGFGANGIMAGSFAAASQSSIGSVVAPGLFATLQSAGAGGYGVVAVNSAVSAGAVWAGGAGALVSRWVGRLRGDSAGEGSGARGDDGPGDGPGGHGEEARGGDGGPQGHTGSQADGKTESEAEDPQDKPKAHL